MLKFAMLTNQGTAAHETCLCERHFTKQNKRDVEVATCGMAPGRVVDDLPIAERWRDCSENEALNCIMC